jgi:hypothetical protein
MLILYITRLTFQWLLGWFAACFLCFSGIGVDKNNDKILQNGNECKWSILWKSCFKITKQTRSQNKEMNGVRSRTRQSNNEVIYCHWTTEQMDKIYSKTNCDFNCTYLNTTCLHKDIWSVRLPKCGLLKWTINWKYSKQESYSYILKSSDRPIAMAARSRYEVSSPAPTLRSWVRITPKAWMAVCIYSVCVVLCVGSSLAMGWSPVQGVVPTVYRIRKLNKRPGPNKGLYNHWWMNEWMNEIVPTVLYDTRNCWAFGLYSSSGILKTGEHNVSETVYVYVLRWGREEPTLQGPLRANLNHWTIQSRCLPPATWGRKQIHFPKRCVFLIPVGGHR